MSRTGQVAAIVLISALSLLVLGWADSYPVSLTAVDDSNLNHINLLFWVGLFLAYPAVFIVGINGTPGVRALCTVVFLFLFTAPKLLYLQTGSDTEVFVGLLDRYQSTNVFDIHDKAYSQWPVVTIWGRLLQLFCRCDSAVAYWLFWGVLIVGFGLSGCLLFSQEPVHNPGDFLGFCLYTLALFWMWDWQVSAYNWSLILVFLILSLLPRGRWPFRLIIILVFTTLTFSHGMVSSWILAVVLLMIVLDWLKSRQRLLSSNFLLTLVVIQTIVLLYHALGLTRRIALTFQNYLTALWMASASAGTVRLMAQGAATPAAGVFDTVTKWLAWFNLGLIAVLLGAGFLTLLWRKRFDVRDWGIFLVGCAYVLVGNLVAVLGFRATNIIVILPVRGLRALLQEKVLRKPTLIVFLLAIILFPTNQLRPQMHNIQYNTTESYRASRYLVPLIEGEFELGVQYVNVLADQAQLYYLVNALPRRAINPVDVRFIEPTRLESFQYVLASTQLEIGLQRSDWPDLDTIIDGPGGGRYNRIYDSGPYVWFGRSPAGDGTEAELSCGECTALSRTNEVTR